MKNSKKLPFISVLIPLKESTYHLLFETLPAFTKQTYKKFEVIVLPNQHSQYDLTLLKKYRWLKIIPTGKITRPAEKRNMGAKNARGQIIAFIDDDAYPDEKWLEIAVKLFDRNVGAVCGPGILPPEANFWEKIFDEVLKNRLGSGGFRYRFIKQKKRYVDDYPSMNFLVKKKLFLKIAGFNARYWPGEDSKLCEDIVYKEGQKILYHPNAVVYHHRRKDLKSYLKQHANYGFHRGAFFAQGDRNSRKFSYLIPTFFLLYLILFSVFSIFVHILNTQYLILYTFPAIPIIIYFFAELYLFIRSFINTKKFFIALGSVLVLFLTHLVYGIMFVKGFIKGYFSKENIYG